MQNKSRIKQSFLCADLKVAILSQPVLLWAFRKLGGKPTGLSQQDLRCNWPDVIVQVSQGKLQCCCLLARQHLPCHRRAGSPGSAMEVAKAWVSFGCRRLCGKGVCCLVCTQLWVCCSAQRTETAFSTSARYWSISIWPLSGLEEMYASSPCWWNIGQRIYRSRLETATGGETCSEGWMALRSMN